ncbi:DUF2512 family protein [Paenibacillus tarimensis]|uniref:DUF2512 family protein n=1 Tax=Paenibacillus tarimensis TaxID=416012 RepID=UPI001F22D630|nr:DUF2512 family protein [Paenibacillus tarimensis]MCF2946472.1 YndM family protein [Paenibacillus tarimensis]
MMNFIVKWLLNGIIVAPLLMFYTGISFTTAAVAASILTVVAYLLGDQVLLRATNNTFATVSDFALVAIYLGMLSYFYNWYLSVGELLIISALVAVAEWFYHRYFLRDKAYSV